MLSREENEFVTRVSPGTPIGNAMRRYWIPACVSPVIATWCWRSPAQTR
jgi:hypothetical protein